jgi:hypothetical protein
VTVHLSLEGQLDLAPEPALRELAEGDWGRGVIQIVVGSQHELGVDLLGKLLGCSLVSGGGAHALLLALALVVDDDPPRPSLESDLGTHQNLFQLPTNLTHPRENLVCDFSKSITLDGCKLRKVLSESIYRDENRPADMHSRQVGPQRAKGPLAYA